MKSWAKNLLWAVGGALIAVLAFLAKNLLPRGNGSSPASAITNEAEAKKKRIAEELKKLSDDELLRRFNSLGDKP